MVDRQCAATKRDGTACHGPALGPTGFCWAHDPSVADRRREAARKGAIHGNQSRALKRKIPDLTNPSELAKFAAQVALGTLGGKITPDVSRATIYALALVRQTVETSALAERLA